jgi:hypothetical protein
MIPPLFGKQEVGIWRVKKHFPRYGVPIWSLWPNIRSLPSIAAEKNVTKNVHKNQLLLPERGGGYTVLPLCVCLSVLPSVQDILRCIFLINCWWQKSDIWSQASYRYPISWEAFLYPSNSYFLFADFVNFYTHLTYICICTFFVAFF